MSDLGADPQNARKVYEWMKKENDDLREEIKQLRFRLNDEQDEQNTIKLSAHEEIKKLKEKADKWDKLNSEVYDVITERGNVFTLDIIEALNIRNKLRIRIKQAQDKLDRYVKSKGITDLYDLKNIESKFRNDSSYWNLRGEVNMLTAIGEI